MVVAAFLAGAFLVVAAFLAGAFLVVAAFLAGAFLVVVLAGAFLVVAAFLAGAFLVVAAFLAGAFLVVVVLTVFSSKAGSDSLASSVAVSVVLTETVFVAVFKENTFGPLSPSSFEPILVFLPNLALN